jgi:short-subunit dehydrogenase
MDLTVLITGASGGLGRAFALECADRGFDILLTDIHAEGLERVKNGILRQYDVRVYAKPCDITNSSEVDSLIHYAKEAGIKLDMLLNVAGIDHEGGFIALNFDNVTEILRVNIEATLRMTYKALSLRRKTGRFYIVFVSSLASMYPMPLKATYAASKRFLLDFSLALGQELKGENVKVLALCPGGMPTNAGCIEAIEAQGFWGKATTNALEKVAHRTISRALCGRKVYIPGTINRLFSVAAKIVPVGMITRLIHNRWHKAQKRWIVNQSA